MCLSVIIDVWGKFEVTLCDQGWWWCVAPQRSAARPPAPSLFRASVASGLPAVVGLKGTARAKMADLGSLWVSQTCCNLRWWRVEYDGKLIFILYCSDIRTSVMLSHVNWSVQAYASDWITLKRGCNKSERKALCKTFLKPHLCDLKHYTDWLLLAVWRLAQTAALAIWHCDATAVNTFPMNSFPS